MSAHLTDTARQLAAVLWKQHTVYRDRTGGVVIRADQVHRWISLANSGTRGEVLVRAGRLLDGGTTAPARAEAVVPLSTGVTGLAATCRRLLADTAEATTEHPVSAPAKSGKASTAGKSRKPRSAGKKQRPARRRRGLPGWVIVVTASGTVALVAVAAAYQSATGR
ncbi:hypothetical protein [Streptomyces apocyni]|uniref:hypothetical protein n=1 Tax=Streptomyces apocyni TaxID=2654677 RepID=UPI001E572173|nr:hypothetical protein [Streptomyces apocyni]